MLYSRLMVLMIIVIMFSYELPARCSKGTFLQEGFFVFRHAYIAKGLNYLIHFAT